MRMTEEEYNALLQHRAAIASYQKQPIPNHRGEGVLKPQTKSGSGAPNKTESEYGLMLRLEYPGCYQAFEGLSFKLQNGHRYTPDWIMQTPDGILCVEVKARGKNGFRQASYQRAKVMFDQSRVEWPMITWRWAEKSQGTWDIKTYKGAP